MYSCTISNNCLFVRERSSSSGFPSNFKHLFPTVFEPFHFLLSVLEQWNSDDKLKWDTERDSRLWGGGLWSTPKGASLVSLQSLREQEQSHPISGRAGSSALPQLSGPHSQFGLPEEHWPWNSMRHSRKDKQGAVSHPESAIRARCQPRPG